MLQLSDRIFYASPDEDTLTPFLEFIKSAKKTLHIADYSFNMKELIPVLQALHDKQVFIDLVLDKSQSAGKFESQDIMALKLASMTVTIGTSDKHQIMHDKFAIVDGVKTLYGSWNFTDTATKEDNFLVIDSNPQVAAWFEQTWQTIKSWILANEPQ